MTHLNFSKIAEFDTFEGTDPDEMALVTEDSVRDHLARVKKSKPKK
jgi:hypothetical protein